jgi:predicted transcriptional regulator
MKTAVSIPDDVFAAADDLAHEMGVSRSRLYALAVADFVAKTRGTNITARLNEVYGREEAGLDDRLRAAQARSV